MVKLSHPYMAPGKTIAFTVWNLVGKVMSLRCTFYSASFFFLLKPILPLDLDDQFCFLIMLVFIGGPLLISFKYFSFTFTT